MFTEIEKETMLDLAQNFTAGQIAEKMKGDVHIIRTFLVSKGIHPLTEGDIITYRLFHEAHKYTKKEMREILGIAYLTFEKYVEETGVTFAPKKKLEAPGAEKKVLNIGKPQTISDMTTKELFEEYTHIVTPSSVPRIKDKYTQSRSPYGLADEVKEIQLTIV